MQQLRGELKDMACCALTSGDFLMSQCPTRLSLLFPFANKKTLHTVHNYPSRTPLPPGAPTKLIASWAVVHEQLSETL